MAFEVQRVVEDAADLDRARRRDPEDDEMPRAPHRPGIGARALAAATRLPKKGNFACFPFWEMAYPVR